jgi:hypothetical protein
MCGRHVTLDEAAMEQAYSQTAIRVEHTFASTRASTLRSRVARGTRDARGRAMGAPTGEAPSAPRACTPDYGGPMRGPRVRCRRKRDAMLDPISAPPRPDSPTVMPEI